MLDDDELPTWLKDPMELILAQYFDPIVRSLRVKTFHWALNHLDEYWEKVLGGKPLSDPVDRVQLEEILKFEIVFTVVQSAEDLVRVFETYRYSNKDHVKTFRSHINATAFYRELDKQSPSYFMDIISAPPGPYGRNPLANLPPRVKKPIQEFRELLFRVRTFYFKYLELYNYYKHGHRLGYVTSPGEDEKPVALVWTLPENADRNVASVDRVDDIDDALYLGEGIIAVARLVKKNWLVRRRDEPGGRFRFAIPGKKREAAERRRSQSPPGSRRIGRRRQRPP